MKYTELAEHLHKLREDRSGRPRGAAMRAAEVWTCVHESQLTEISELRWFDVPLPRPVDGVFARLKGADGKMQTGIILTHKHLPKHWKDFAAIKEMMHCWSPPGSYVAAPADADALLEGLISSTERYSASVAADKKAILAAAEVILPHYKVDWHIGCGHDHDQIAAHHGLHPEVVRLICRFDVLQDRRNGDMD